MAIMQQFMSGGYLTSQRHVLIRRQDIDPTQAKLIICYHGNGADATQFSMSYDDLYQHMEVLAEAGYVLMSIDGGPTLTGWANNDSLLAIGGAAAYAAHATAIGIDRPRTRDGKLALMGWSMGGLTTIQAILRLNTTPSEWCAGGFVWAPAIDIERYYSMPERTADINAAYGGNWITNGRNAVPSWNPYARMSDMHPDVPLRIVHSSDDTTTAIEDAQAFAAGTPNTTLHTVSGAGHFPFTAYDPADTLAFYNSLDWD